VPDPPIVNVGYRSTNYWVIGFGGSRLLVDLGWPGTFGTLRATLRRAGVPLEAIRYGLATHFHIDHAGLGQELKNAGVPLLVTPDQLASIPLMKAHTTPRDEYLEIRPDDNVVVTCDASRALLATIGLEGEIVHTPGHSADSVSLVLDSGAAFTGDLTPPALATDEQAAMVQASWQRLLDKGATRVYPGHGPIRPLR
jgi:glyoxylase-like metal-dependent hydrolase (beta-lactamase superfamily II)